MSSSNLNDEGTMMADRKKTPDMFADMTASPMDAVALAMGDGSVALPVSKCRLDGGTQSRVRIDDGVVKRYSNDLANGDKFKPVEVFFDGTDYWVSDGFHRVKAHMALGLAEINAIVKQGTRRDAVLASTGANPRHGLQRTDEDIRRAVMVLLEDEEWSQWSDRKIAITTHTSHPFVAGLRKLVSGNVTTPAVQVVDLPVEKATTSAPVNGRSKPAPVPVAKPAPVFLPASLESEWDALTWAVHDWAMAKLPDSRRLFELKDMIMTRQNGRYWKGIVSAVEAAGVTATQGAIISAVSKVRLALVDGTVPARDVVEIIDTYQQVPRVSHNVTAVVTAEPPEIKPTWRVEHQPDRRRLMIHNKDGKERKYLLTEVEAMFLSAELAHPL
jgi:hypothetical protein